MTAVAAVRFDHLQAMCDSRGLFEHAEGTIRREEHGYCTDDNARLLVVACREPGHGAADRLARLALRFVLDAQVDDGRMHNRMDRLGRWVDSPSTDDCWGRSLWGLGVASVHHGDPSLRIIARRAFDLGTRARSASPRAMAFAAIGAAEVLGDDPVGDAARSMLADALTTIGPVPDGPWPWPEPRLTYANAALAESVIAAGAALGREADLERGLAMLTWLLELETRDGHLSPTGVGGRGPDDTGPQFDQQPIEVAAMADACSRAFTVTGDRCWLHGVEMAARWFCGDNDTGATMFDARSGGGFDGLQPEGVNLNQGAESTLAFVSTMQRARSLNASA